MNAFHCCANAIPPPLLGWMLLVEIATLSYLWGSSAWLPARLRLAQAPLLFVIDGASTACAVTGLIMSTQPLWLAFWLLMANACWGFAGRGDTNRGSASCKP